MISEVEVNYIECENDNDTLGEVVITNSSLNIEEVLRYSIATLSHLWRWHDLRKGMRVFAIEPSNCEIKPRSAAQASNTMKILKPGETQNYFIEVEIRDI